MMLRLIANLKQSRERLVLHLNLLNWPKVTFSLYAQLRVLQSELNVEDIIKERTYKAFNERCRSYFHAE